MEAHALWCVGTAVCSSQGFCRDAWQKDINLIHFCGFLVQRLYKHTAVKAWIAKLLKGIWIGTAQCFSSVQEKSFTCSVPQIFFSGVMLCHKQHCWPRSSLFSSVLFNRCDEETLHTYRQRTWLPLTLAKMSVLVLYSFQKASTVELLGDRSQRFSTGRTPPHTTWISSCILAERISPLQPPLFLWWRLSDFHITCAGCRSAQRVYMCILSIYLGDN